MRGKGNGKGPNSRGREGRKGKNAASTLRRGEKREVCPFTFMIKKACIAKTAINQLVSPLRLGGKKKRRKGP